MLQDLRLLRTLCCEAARPELGLRKTLLLGVLQEGVVIGLGVAAPLLLKLCVDGVGHSQSAVLELLIAAFVVSWTAPTLMAAIRLSQTMTLVDGIYRHLAGLLLKRQLPHLAGAKGPDSGQVTGLLERLPFSLTMVLDGLIGRAAPLALQIVLGLATLALATPPRYALLLGFILLGYLLLAGLGGSRLAAATSKAALSASRVSAELTDVVQNAERIICNGALSFELNRLSGHAEEHHRRQRDAADLIVRSATLQVLLLAIGLIVVLIVAGFDVSKRQLSAGDFVLLQAFALRLALPLGNVASTLRQSGAPLANIREVLALCDDAAWLGEEVGSPAHPVKLELNQVCFGFSQGRADIQNLSLSLEPDQLVAIVGPNGSGKSTLARLMAGLLSPDSGQVRIGGVDLTRISSEQRVASVLYVPQFIRLFNRSLVDNGLYPPSEQTHEALAERLRLWRFREGEPALDLRAFAGEHGAKLSGGQVQKLELARLYAVDTPILILDESTSALDGVSEAEIVRTLRARFTGRLLILITHHAALAKAADLVLFMDSGRIAARGLHSALMRLSSYRQLWDGDPNADKAAEAGR